MDAFNVPTVHTVVVESSAQIAKTTIIENIIGYYIDQDPSPILIMQPTLEMSKAFSKDRLAPMLRDTPCLNGIVADPKSRDSGNEILHKTFIGGHITMAGANSPATLAQRPIKVAIGDDVDRFPASAGTEGDPVDLLFKRTTAFWNKKKGLFSTPTVKGYSRIEKAYLGSDMRKFWVPCPKCGEFQLLIWGQVKWPKQKGNKGEDVHLTGEACYECEHCEYLITDADKIRMVRHGEWRAERELKGVVGFWINELYSPFVSFQEMADSFIKAKREGREALRVFVNTSLAETFEEKGDTVSDVPLMERRENYKADVPMEVGVLTCAVDVQGDRLEAEILGWGKREESWSIDYKIFYGDTVKLLVWKDLDDYLLSKWKHESGVMLRIVCTAIDSGDNTQMVYKFVKPRQGRRVFAIKGKGGVGMPLVSRPTKNNSLKVSLFTVGTDTGKDLLYSRLKIDEFGAGYCHFPAKRELEYFKQLTAEKKLPKYVKGRLTGYHYIKKRARNEALDLRVYNMAALDILSPNLDLLVDKLQREDVEEKENKGGNDGSAEGDKPSPKKRFQKSLKRSNKQGFVNRW